MEHTGATDYLNAKPPSNHSFGYVFGGFFLILALWPLLSGMSPRGWALAMAAVFVLAAKVYPSSLATLNKTWFRFGLLLHGIVSPLALGIVFFAVITPIALVMRLVGHDSLQRSFEATADSYWHPREPNPLDNMENQF